MSSQNGHARRHRAGSLKEALHNIENDPNHSIGGSLATQTPPARTPSPKTFPDGYEPSLGFIRDVYRLRWLRRPSTSARMLGLVFLLYCNWIMAAPKVDNPFSRFIFISGRISDDSLGRARYAKSYWDLAFIAYYIVVWSFIRQGLTIYVLKPLARHWGITKPGKVERFAEQSYAVIYNTVMGSFAVYVMRYELPTWYFRTENFWMNYPHWEMPAALKYYYLLEFTYWAQQTIIIGFKIEKPRSDYYVLVAHHLVTMWLIGWSYLINLTHIGNAVFITMDWSDAFFSLAKCFNYLNMEKTKTIAFAWFTICWTYLRHYLNIVILYSVWTEFDLVPKSALFWAPETGAWLAPWMRYQIFAPLFLLQLLNLFWYFLIWRILLRAIFSATLDDSRSDDEDEEHEPASKKKKD